MKVLNEMLQSLIYEVAASVQLGLLIAYESLGDDEIMLCRYEANIPHTTLNG